MRTWWLVNRDSSEVDHWYEDNGCIYALSKNGPVRVTSISLAEMKQYTRDGILIMRDLPEAHARGLSNNRSRLRR